jgi:hypothetical protein
MIDDGRSLTLRSPATEEDGEEHDRGNDGVRERVKGVRRHVELEKIQRLGRLCQ